MLWISKWTGPSYYLSRDFKSIFATSSMSRHRPHVAISTSVSAVWNGSFMMSRHQFLIATSPKVFCRLQMVAPDVATSISCRDINLMNCSFQLMSSDVATSISCRDITLCLLSSSVRHRRTKSPTCLFIPLK